jgi:two-component system KDP operon response regulator KdpE
MSKKVLLIDDDPDLGHLVETVLRPIEVTLYQSYSGNEGMRTAYDIHPDLIILDVMMPNMDGFEVCSRLRELSDVPILMLTARTNPNDMLHGFKIGVDDFVRKPFANDELEARVRALLRRSPDRPTGNADVISAYKDEYLEVDLTSHTVKLYGEIIELTQREYSLLAVLVQEQGKILSHPELVRKAWGVPFINSAPAVSSLYIFYIRKKIQDDQHGHKYIHTFWGRGYWFEPWHEE